MFTPLQQYTADHRFLLDAAAKAAGIEDPVAFDGGTYVFTLLKHAKRGPLVSIDGALTRAWTAAHRYYYPGTPFGIRLYKFQDIPFARCVAQMSEDAAADTYDFFVTSRSSYIPLFRHTLRLQRKKVDAAPPPVLDDKQFDILFQNTLGYLDRKNLKRIKDLGGRPKRGLLLTGPPGNGKTSACRWLWKECTRLGHEYRLVTPDAYRAARNSCNPVEQVKALFSVERRGLVFFDDMDIALRDRETVRETEDQAVFLSALDGIEVNEGVVYVFTTNCSLELIDSAFKRPGRIDLILKFELPNATLRRRLMDRWHADIQNNVDLKTAVHDTDSFSFAEVEELKNLLILRHIDAGDWDWNWAMNQFRLNRGELAGRRAHSVVGFAEALKGINGFSNGN
jgi:cell division protease FtsH